jgi:hypothetical protein
MNKEKVLKSTRNKAIKITRMNKYFYKCLVIDLNVNIQNSPVNTGLLRWFSFRKKITNKAFSTYEPCILHINGYVIEVSE